MSNKASNQLFLLVKSLSKQEKRYFKIFSNRHSSENNNYYKLYQIISQQDEYNEDEVILKLKDEQFINRLSIAKTRLYEQLLKSLNAYHANKTIDSELFSILMSVEVLYNKALYKSAWKKLQRGFKLAEKHEKHEILLQYYKWNHKLLEKDNYERVDAKKIDNLLNAEKKVVDQIKIYQKLWFIKSKIFKVIFYNGSKSGTEVGMINLFLEKHINSIDKNKLSINSAFLLHHIYSAFYYSTHSLDKAYRHLQSNLDLMEKNPQMFVDNPFSQISVLSNMAFIAFKLKKHRELTPLLLKLRNFKNLTEESDINLQIRWFYSYYSIYLAIQSEKSTVVINDVEVKDIYKGLEKYREKLPTFRRIDMEFALSVYYFKAGETRTALRKVHAILNEMNSKMNPDMFYATRFFYLILLLEMEKVDYLNVAWNSTKRSLFARKDLTPEIRVLKDFFDRVCKSGQPDLYVLADGLIQGLENLKSNAFTEYFDFKKWAVDKKESFETSGALAS